MAIVKPRPRYSAAIFQPNRANSSASATSFTIGAEIRKENVTPSGTPACTKPMNSGTAEQEQNGVTMPSERRHHIAHTLMPAGQQWRGCAPG